MESIRNPLPKPPKYIDVDYMTLPDIDSNPLFYDEDAQEMLTYWTDGKMVYWYFGRASRDVEHFVWFNRLFAKDMYSWDGRQETNLVGPYSVRDLYLDHFGKL